MDSVMHLNEHMERYCIYKLSIRMVLDDLKNTSCTKKQSIPCLELLGALILTRLVNSVLMYCPQKLKVTCWVDSTSTLFWIKNHHPWIQYILHRVNEIQRSSSVHQWGHCPRAVNPADLPSRGLDAEQLHTCAL